MTRSAPVGVEAGNKGIDDLQLDAVMSTAAIAWGWLCHVAAVDDRVKYARHLLGQMLDKDLKRYGTQMAGPGRSTSRDVRSMTRPAVDGVMVERAFNAWCDVAEVDEWRVRNPREAITAALTAALAQQPAAVDGATRRDAERYRFLRDNNGVANHHGVEVYIDGEAHAPGHLDAQVDAALAVQPGGSKQ